MLLLSSAVENCIVQWTLKTKTPRASEHMNRTYPTSSVIIPFTAINKPYDLRSRRAAEAVELTPPVAHTQPVVPPPPSEASSLTDLTDEDMDRLSIVAKQDENTQDTKKIVTQRTKLNEMSREWDKDIPRAKTR